MLQNPETKKKPKYQRRPPLVATAVSGCFVPGLEEKASIFGIVPALTSYSLASTGESSFIVPEQPDRRVRFKSRRESGTEAEVTCQAGNESHGCSAFYIGELGGDFSLAHSEDVHSRQVPGLAVAILR